MSAADLFGGSTAVTVTLASGVRVLVDEQYAPLLSERGWYRNVNGYVMRDRQVSGHRQRVYFHRLIMDAQPGEDVDHINGDPLDVRRSNLRRITHAQNLQNRRGARRDSGTRVRGVYFDRRRPKAPYCAYLKINQKKIHLGAFATLDAAEDAVRAGRRQHMTHSVECVR